MRFNSKIQILSPLLKNIMIQKNIWQISCPVAMEDLRLVTVNHYDFNLIPQIGEIIVHFKIAENTVNIFKKLYALKFPIHKIKTIDYYDGDDEKSMEDNNSSGFNYRKIVNSNIISMHSYGLAIDINPKQNPYIIINSEEASAKIFPKYGQEFLNRTNLRAGMVESVIHIFAEEGLNEWGGHWNTPLDWHHFQVKRESLKDYFAV